MDLFEIISVPFGLVFRWLNGLTGSYLFTVILFSIVLKLVLFPFSIKQQKNSQKQAKLRPKENVIRKKYAGRNDRATMLKMNTEIQEMYQKENYSPFGGCLPMILQMLVLLAVYGVVRAPLTYANRLPSTAEFTADEVVVAVQESATYLAYSDGEVIEDRFLVRDFNPENEEELWELLEEGKFHTYAEIRAVTYIDDNKDKFIEFFDATDRFEKDGVTGQQIVDALPEMELSKGSGFNLGEIPNFSVFSAEKTGTKLLFLVPVLTLVTSYFGQALTRKFTYQPEQAEEVKNQMRMMNIFMPLFSFYISTIVPAGVGVYWMMSNILGPVQQFALSKIFPIKEITPEEMKEAERLYGGKQKKKKTTASTGKRRSLVYDDDDEYESVSSTTEKKVLKEKKTDEKSIVEKAPLKDESKK